MVVVYKMTSENLSYLKWKERFFLYANKKPAPAPTGTGK